MELCGRGCWKLLLGAVYKMVLAAAAYKVMGYFETGHIWYQWVVYAYAYGAYLFFDFAGYSLMAVGSSYILGIELPDNFNLPFISKDIREFWDRWHISLSHWFRDFVFQCKEKMVFKQIAAGMCRVFREHGDYGIVAWRERLVYSVWPVSRCTSGWH